LSANEIDITFADFKPDITLSKQSAHPTFLTEAIELPPRRSLSTPQSPPLMDNATPPAPLAPPSLSDTTQAERVAWFAQEVHPHDGQLKAYLRGLFPYVRDVDDIVQESYLRVWRVRAARMIESPKAFLFTVARHLGARMAWESRHAPVEFVGDLCQSRLIEGRPNPAEALSYQEKVALLAEAIALLPGRCREIIILRKIQCLPQKQVAAQLGLSERTVENQVARGVARCHDFFRERGVQSLF
jgi:RNA polymerase sigma factor (sigma-70 family)